MTILRSREILSPKTLAAHSSSTPKSMPPSRCPSPNLDPPRSGYYAVSDTGPPCRRSLRLASKSGPAKIPVSRCRRKRSIDSAGNIGPCLEEAADGGIGDADLAEKERGFDSLSSEMGSPFAANSTDSGEDDDASADEGRGGSKRLKVEADAGSDLRLLEDEAVREVLSLRSGKRIVKRGQGIVTDGDRGEGIGLEFESNLSAGGGEEEVNSAGRKSRYSREEKGKGKLAMDGLDSKGVDLVHLDSDKSTQGAMQDERAKEKFKEDPDNDDGKRPANARLSREEKGKAKLDKDDDTKGAVEISGANTALNDLIKKLELIEEAVQKMTSEKMKFDMKESRRREYKERFRAVAKENAHRFAHFNAEEENRLVLGAGPASNQVEPEPEPEHAVEDWPGPFSTAMKIIRDREKKLTNQAQKSSSQANKEATFTWVPKNNKDFVRKIVPPSLKELCLRVLADNADAIASLDNLPDSIRHKLSHLLCGSRKMNGDVFSLFLRGSPTEVRVKDCSWLSEEQFTKSYDGCDTSNLTVLQLDQCGRCMPDYILHSTIAQSPCSLPALTTLSLSGACRLSDTGLSVIVSSAPALRSINLNQCSLLTSAGINIIADNLGSVLREIYINDCQSIDAMLMLPSLKRLEHLEVLSVGGIQTVCDDFVKEFITVLGHNMKELVFTDCVKLTDSSMKVIAENCPGLLKLDLVDLCKLTDSTMGYLANGCQAIQNLKLRRNKFSDEAVAAFLESSGELLKELSLNNIKKVGQNTAFSLASRSRNLQILDLSWCRNLTDEAMGLIVDSCSSLKVLKLFGCTQITNVFLEGHSNAEVEIIGLKMSSFLKEIEFPGSGEGLAYNSLISASI